MKTGFQGKGKAANKKNKEIEKNAEAALQHILSVALPFLGGTATDKQ